MRWSRTPRFPGTARASRPGRPAMNDKQKTDAAAGPVAENQANAKVTPRESRGTVSDAQDRLSEARKAVVTAVAAKTQTMATETKEAVADAQAMAREAVTAVASKMQAMAGEAKEGVRDA